MKKLRRFWPATEGCPIYGEVLSASEWEELAESAYNLTVEEGQLDERRLASAVDLLKWANPKITESTIDPGTLVVLPTLPGLMWAPENGGPQPPPAPPPPPEPDWGASGETAITTVTTGTTTKNGQPCTTGTSTVRRYGPIEEDHPITIGFNVVISFAGTQTWEAALGGLGITGTVYEFCVQLHKKVRVKTRRQWKLFTRLETICLNQPPQIHYAAVEPVQTDTDEGHYDYSEPVGAPDCRIEATASGDGARGRAEELRDAMVASGQPAPGIVTQI